MKKLLTLLALILSTIVFSQSKKELRADLYNARQNVKSYKSLSNTWKEKSDDLIRQNEELKTSLDDFEDQLIKILPHLTVSEGFPEKFYPTNSNIGLYDEFFSNKQEYRRSDSSIFSENNTIKYPTSYDGSPDTVLLLGVIDTTLHMNYANVVYGTVPVVYKGKIRYTTFFDLKGSLGHKHAEGAYKKKELIDEFGEDIGEKIYQGRPWVGMTYWELRAMYGNFYDRSSYEGVDGSIDIYIVKESFRTYSFTVIKGKVTSISTN